MNILVINGSPKGTRSNTYKLTKAFLEGMKQAEQGKTAEIAEISTSQLNIKPCLGCFSCWNKTPGTCCIHDDMQMALEKLLWADITIWSFPLYYFNVPGPLKNLIDRQLPMVLPFMVEREDHVGNGSHPTRYDMSGKKNVLISTCGFYTAQGNYDSVLEMFDHMCGKNKYTTLFCGQGELFRVPEVSKRTNKYLDIVRTAGKEYLEQRISEDTRKELECLLYPKKTFERMADASWGIDKESGEKEDESLIFTKQMAALYQKESYSGEDKVLEMYYTDKDKVYQIVLGKEGSRVYTDGSQSYTTRIETPYSVWQSIASGKISGEEAMMQGLYKVKGDFNMMLHWDEYFGDTGATSEARQSTEGNTRKMHIPYKDTNMNMMLIPWIVFWVAAAIDNYAGSLMSIGICVLLPLIFYSHKKTMYDVITGVLVTGFSIVTLVGVNERITLSLSYLAFGIMWVVSCFGSIPLTAHYSMNQYKGEIALKNPLFLKTNKILTLLWGILYMLTPIWTYAIMGTKASSYIGAINSILPIFMGAFTIWFQKWYPAKVARGD